MSIIHIVLYVAAAIFILVIVGGYRDDVQYLKRENEWLRNELDQARKANPPAGEGPAGE